MACTEYDDEPEPLTVFHRSGTCCEGVGEDVTNYDPPAQGSELTLSGSLSINVISLISGAVAPSGTISVGLDLVGGLSLVGSLSGSHLIASLSPYLWLDSADPLDNGGDYSGIANGADLDTWFDKSGNNRNMPYDNLINRKPKFWKIANSGSGSPSALPNTGLPIISTKDVGGSGARVFGTITGGPLAPATAGTPGTNWSLYLVGRRANPTGVIPFLGSWCQFGGGNDQPMIIGPNDTGDPDVFYMGYRNAPAGTQHRILFALNTITTNEYWRFSIQRSAGTHTCWQHNTSLSVSATVGTPADQAFILQWLARYQDNTNGDHFFEYEFSEVILFNKVLTADERTSVWSYLDNKWGLS